MPWLRTYITICAGVLALAFVALVLLVSFADLGLSGHGITALFIGALLAIALAMVLMGLLFMSDRGGYDANTYGAGVGKGQTRDFRPQGGGEPGAESREGAEQ